MLLKRGTWSGERGTGSGERGAGSGERGTGNGERGAGKDHEERNETLEQNPSLEPWPYQYLHFKFSALFQFFNFPFSVLPVLVTSGVNVRWQLVRVLPFLSLVLMLKKDEYLIT